MGEIIDVSDDAFEAEVLGGKRPVVVDFWAPWCGPCRVIAPIMKELAEQHDGRIKFVKLNVDDNPRTAARYNVLSIPTLILFEGGEAQSTVVGARPRSHFEQTWAQWLSAAA